MLVGVISDTHDRLENMSKAVGVFKENKVEMIIHCGDWVSPFAFGHFVKECGDWKVPIKSVLGNNEGDIKHMLEKNARLADKVEFADYQAMELEIEGKKAVIYHGHDEVLLKSLIDSQQYEVIFTGHTHRIKNEIVGKTLVLNPGSAGYAFDEEASIALFDTNMNQVEIIRLSI